jgi:hypothetical protein
MTASNAKYRDIPFTSPAWDTRYPYSGHQYINREDSEDQFTVTVYWRGSENIREPFVEVRKLDSVESNYWFVKSVTRLTDARRGPYDDIWVQPDTKS